MSGVVVSSLVSSTGGTVGTIVVYSVSVAVSVWPLEWYISVPVNTGVSF
jgi:hypothetical protein